MVNFGLQIYCHFSIAAIYKTINSETFKISEFLFYLMRGFSFRPLGIRDISYFLSADAGIFFEYA